jgi:hypothetical protein
MKGCYAVAGAAGELLFSVFTLLVAVIAVAYFRGELGFVGRVEVLMPTLGAADAKIRDGHHCAVVLTGTRELPDFEISFHSSRAVIDAC